MRSPELSIEEARLRSEKLGSSTSPGLFQQYRPLTDLGSAATDVSITGTFGLGLRNVRFSETVLAFEASTVLRQAGAGSDQPRLINASRDSGDDW